MSQLVPGFDSVRVLNIDILRIREQQLLATLDSGVLFTPNLDHLCQLQHDAEFYDCYQKAEWVICDSRVLFFSSWLFRLGITESISGSSFFTHYYMYHQDDPDCRIFLLGAAEGVAQEAMRRINDRVGREIVVGAHSPSYGFENNVDECRQICEIINQSLANVVLVGVGAPKQEKWIMANKESMPGVKLWLALGATIDFEAGHVKRAPRIFQKLALEWLYRMYCEPRRMFKRYICNDLAFFVHLFKFKIGTYRNPFSDC